VQASRPSSRQQSGRQPPDVGTTRTLRTQLLAPSHTAEVDRLFFTRGQTQDVRPWTATSGPETGRGGQPTGRAATSPSRQRAHTATGMRGARTSPLRSRTGWKSRRGVSDEPPLVVLSPEMKKKIAEQELRKRKIEEEEKGLLVIKSRILL
jgi:hypothetical protein